MGSELVPPSLVDLVPIYDVADEIEPSNPRIAYLCRTYAFEKAQIRDPNSAGRGVHQFKTAQIRSLQKQDAATIGRRIKKSDAQELKSFYWHYYRKYIRALQNADIPDRTLLARPYQAASVLFEVLKAVSPVESAAVANDILKEHAQFAEKELDHASSHPEILKAHKKVVQDAHNILPSGPASSDKLGKIIPPKMKQLKHLKIPLQAIKNCTQDFDEKNFIGKGGYGRVYTGILSWGDHVNQLVAVKRLDVTGFQGNKEFQTELTMLSQYQHENIITLIGFCDDNKEMILVYEYASHGSLDTYLHDTTISGGLSWSRLLKICIGVASALDYLHNHVAEKHRIIHRDIKSANVLLDENWNAKLSDFGLSRIGLANQHNTFVITNLAGTHGYCDPQYERTGFLTKESDVYSFGVVLFEVLCGRLACVCSYHDERRFLHHFAQTCYRNGELDKIIDHRIRKDMKPITLLKFSAIAYQCLQETREDRPTIAEVVFQLKEATKIQLEDDIRQDELEDGILQNESEDEILQVGTKRGRLGILKSKLKLRFCGCLKKQ